MAEPVEITATETAEAPPATGRQVTSLLDTAAGIAELDLGGALRTIARRHGKTYQQIVVEIARLGFGQGQLDADEYIALQLYDDSRFPAAAKKEFVGLEGMRRILAIANWDQEWWGIARSKLAATHMLAAFGFPVPETLGVFSRDLELPAYPRLSTTTELATFLRNPAHYPLFGKPTDSQQSIGSTSLARYVAETDEVESYFDDRTKVEALAAEIAHKFADGYMLQRRVVPHARTREICGDRLATCRLITCRTSRGIEVLRALWKIPGGRNVADNYWRSGNLIAGLDLDSGIIKRVVTGSGVSLQEVECHPASGVRLVGQAVPEFQRMKDMVVAGHRLFHKLGLLGWDIAPTEDGIVVVEPNLFGDCFLPQLADARGLLDERMQSYLGEWKAEAEASKRLLTVDLKARMRARRQRLVDAATSQVRIA
jgi:hypothetical protein